MRIVAIALLAFTFVSPSAFAQNSPWYTGITAGLMDGGPGIGDSAINAGFDVGYQVNRYLSTEFQYTRTFVDGETNVGNDWEVDTASIYATLRTDTEIMLKGKIGLSHLDSGNNSDTDLSLGFGVSFWALGGLTEIEYTIMDDDSDLEFLSFSIKLFF